MAKEKDYKLPEGFEDATPPRNWALIEEGVTIQGVLLSREERGGEDEGKFFYDIRITEPHNLLVQTGPKETNKPHPAAVGEIVSMDERARTAFLEDLWGDAEWEWEVHIHFQSKKPHPSKKGQTIWNIRNGKRRLGKRQAA